ncbi:MAG: TRAP transporter small permease [Pseudomonadota bacterium]
MTEPSAPAGTFTSGMLARCSRGISLACLWLAGAGLVAMSATILWQVFARYVLNASPSWSEQLALYVLVWTVLLAAAAGVREQYHIRITALEQRLGEATGRRLRLAAHTITAAMGACLFTYGSELVLALWAYPIPTLGLPRGSAFACVPLAGALMIAFSLEHMLAILRRQSVRPAWN